MTHPPMNRIPVDELDQYLRGTASADVRARVQTWIASHPDAQAYVERMTRRPNQNGVDAAWVDVDARIGVIAAPHHQSIDERKRAELVSSHGTRSRRSTVTREWHRVAWTASALIVAIAFYFGALRPSSPHDLGVTRTYATGTGQQATFTMVDGTEVTLAPRTTLRLSRFGTGFRTVTLDGQAYFSVTHHGAVPFSVRSGDVTTRVLGTAFMVRHYVTDPSVRIAVAEGKVAATNTTGRANVTLTAGRVADVMDSIVKVTPVSDLTPETGWMRDRLAFNDAPIRDVLATLSRWYGYEFHLTDSSMAQRHITVALSTRSSAEALVVLEKLLHVNLTVNGNMVTLTPARVRRDQAPSRLNAYEAWTPNKEIGR